MVVMQAVAQDPTVRSVSFSQITPLTPYSFKVSMPSDISSFSIRHVVVVGVLLPKDHRAKCEYLGIELALKLILQTEWFAGWDMVNLDNAPLVVGVKRPKFMAPSGGSRLQLLTQISKMKFTMYPASTLPGTLLAAMSLHANPNFVQRVALTAAVKGNEEEGMTIEKGIESKRKREGYLEAFVESPGINANMTTDEVDRHRKVQFVERMSNAIVERKGSNLSMDVGNVEDMNEDEIDNLLGQVLMRYVNVCIERCSTKSELLSELNWSGYSGLSLLHHACFSNNMALITLLLNNGADANILSAEGDLTPLHFAAAAGHKDVVDALIRQGCNPIALDCNNETPADHARRTGHVEIAAMLQAYNDEAGLAPRAISFANPPTTTSDIFLQSAFKELSLKDKLGLNLFVDRRKAAPLAFVRKTSSMMATDWASEGIGRESSEYLGNDGAFSFINEEDRAKLREAMSLANEMDLKEMNLRAESQDVRQYLCQSNYEVMHFRLIKFLLSSVNS